VVAEGHEGREEIQDNIRDDEIDPLPYGIGDTIGAGGKCGGRVGPVKFDLVFGQGES